MQKIKTKKKKKKKAVPGVFTIVTFKGPAPKWISVLSFWKEFFKMYQNLKLA